MSQPAETQDAPASSIQEPSGRVVFVALLLWLAFVLATRLPVARSSTFDHDEMGYMEAIQEYRLPPAHTLFLASGRLVGLAIGDPYRGFIALDMVVSALALTAVWWWLRALVRPGTAVAATLVLGVSPIFWSYGALAASYSIIPLVGSLLLGIAYRGTRQPRAWHPYAAAVVLAVGAGYRQDVGMLWSPVFLLILWQHRWLPALQAGLLSVALTLAWFVPMLHDVGGWTAYRAVNARFAHGAGYLNSVFHLGLIDATLRYAFKMAVALVLTLGPALAIVPFGLARLRTRDDGVRLLALLALSVVAALGLHLTIHFGVPGYAFHYVPALLALTALGAGAGRMRDRAPSRLGFVAAALAAYFAFYPVDYLRGGMRGDFDLSYGRYTRRGLAEVPPLRVPSSWRTANSVRHPGAEDAPTAPRASLSEVAASLASDPSR